jgi:3-isopropylmalate/(R)-2-methylmalate dehydratase small subunit
MEAMWGAIDANPGVQAKVDLPAQIVSIGELNVSFEIDEYTKWRLMEGLDDIGITLQNEAAIAAFEAKRESWRPKTLPAKGV